MDTKYLINKFTFIVLLTLTIIQMNLAQDNDKQTEKLNPTNSDTEYSMNLPIEVVINGKILKIMATAFDSFQKESLIPENKRNVENYIVIVQEDKENFIVTFFAKRTNDELINLLGGGNNLGRDVKYLIDKENIKVIKRTFMK